MALVFNPGNHTYRLDGRPVPGVTSILGVLDKPAIPRWAAGEVAAYVADNPDGLETLRAMGRDPMVNALKGIPWARRDTAAIRGKDIHGFAERMVDGEQVDVPDALTGHVESTIRFMDDYGIKPVLTECAVGSRRHMYGGTLDLVADSDTHPRAIFDYKTGASGIYGETAFQNAAYAFADFAVVAGEEVPMSEMRIERSFGVWIRADGYDVYPLEFSPRVFNEFLAIRAAFEAKRRATGNWKIPGTGYVGISEQQLLGT